MSTVPKAGDPAPPNNAKTLTIGDGSGMYTRPTAGGGATGDNQGPGPGPTPGYSINMTGAAPTDAGPNFGHGATQIVAQPDATGHPSSDSAGGGTVGNSGPGLGQ